MKDIKTTAEIDLTESAVYVTKDGTLTKITPKQYGQDVLIWQNGSVLDIDRSERVRIQGQDII